MFSTASPATRYCHDAAVTAHGGEVFLGGEPAGTLADSNADVWSDRRPTWLLFGLAGRRAIDSGAFLLCSIVDIVGGREVLNVVEALLVRRSDGAGHRRLLGLGAAVGVAPTLSRVVTADRTTAIAGDRDRLLP